MPHMRAICLQYAESCTVVANVIHRIRTGLIKRRGEADIASLEASDDSIVIQLVRGNASHRDLIVHSEFPSAHVKRSCPFSPKVLLCKPLFPPSSTISYTKPRILKYLCRVRAKSGKRGHSTRNGTDQSNMSDSPVCYIDLQIDPATWQLIFERNSRTTPRTNTRILPAAWVMCWGCRSKHTFMQALTHHENGREIRRRSRLACDKCASSRVKCNGDRPW